MMEDLREVDISQALAGFQKKTHSCVLLNTKMSKKCFKNGFSIAPGMVKGPMLVGNRFLAMAI